MWQSNEYRLQTDFRAVQNERAKLQQLIDNLNSVNSESEKTRSEERQRMEKRVEEAQRELYVLFCPFLPHGTKADSMNSTVIRTQLQEARDATAAAEVGPARGESGERLFTDVARNVHPRSTRASRLPRRPFEPRRRLPMASPPLAKSKSIISQLS